MRSEVQSVLFDKDLFTRRSAISWLRKHGFKSSKVDETNRYYRFRQFTPNKNRRHRIKEIDDGIKFIFEFDK
jgi:hypothetical protein